MQIYHNEYITCIGNVTSNNIILFDWTSKVFHFKYNSEKPINLAIDSKIEKSALKIDNAEKISALKELCIYAQKELPNYPNTSNALEVLQNIVEYCI